MTIGERLFKIMNEKNISMPELSRMTGISRHTIFDWQRRNTNPGADKIMVICEALQITPEELLVGKQDNEKPEYDHSIITDDIEMQIMKECHDLSEAKKKRLLAYVSMLQNTKEREEMDNEQNDKIR
jgi:transcriptional regulator with XRE-family HTH domain